MTLPVISAAHQSPSPAAVDVMGERGGQASQIAPDAQLDNFVGQQVAAGLATASIVVLGHLMQSALECALRSLLQILVGLSICCVTGLARNTTQARFPRA